LNYEGLWKVMDRDARWDFMQEDISNTRLLLLPTSITLPSCKLRLCSQSLLQLVDFVVSRNFTNRPFPRYHQPPKANRYNARNPSNTSNEAFQISQSATDLLFSDWHSTCKYHIYILFFSDPSRELKVPNCGS
jgi:hypothetical protein